MPRFLIGALIFSALFAFSDVPLASAQQAAPLVSAAQSIKTPELAREISSYLDSMLDDASKQLGDKTISKQERERRVISFLYKYGDMPIVAHNLTGRYWTRATEAQQKGYMKSFEDYVLWSFADGLDELNGGQSVRVDDILPAGNEFFVRSNIVEKGSDPAPVDWKLRRDGAGFRITDVQLEGVSPLRMMQDDFMAVLRGSFGNFDALIAALQHKITLPKTAPGPASAPAPAKN